jgi:ApaG protein
VTCGVTVRVRPDFMPEQSNRRESRFVWAYTVEIENRSEREIQLISRRWEITDGLNRTETVRGSGVVGEQPSLKPGEAYRYASACPLSTPSGLMGGAYQMLAEDGELFEVVIPTFSLDLPDAGGALN